MEASGPATADSNAGLFVSTLSNLQGIDLGFNCDKTLLLTVNGKQAVYQDAALGRFYDSLRKRLSSIPGVQSVTLSNFALVSGAAADRNITIPGLAPDKNHGTYVLQGGPSFFSTMAIPILIGREIDERDNAAAPRVAVVNEVFAKTYFGSANPVGRHFGFGAGPSSVDIEIIGVARTARYDTLKTDVPPTVYLAYMQYPRGPEQMVYELRTAADPVGYVDTVRRSVREADARIPMFSVRSQASQNRPDDQSGACLCQAL